MSANEYGPHTINHGFSQPYSSRVLPLDAGICFIRGVPTRAYVVLNTVQGMFDDPPVSVAAFTQKHVVSSWMISQAVTTMFLHFIQNHAVNFHICLNISLVNRQMLMKASVHAAKTPS